MILGNSLVKERTEKSKYNNAPRSYRFVRGVFTLTRS